MTSIFSVDIQPHGTRLATCGQDCAIKIWHLPLLAQLAQQCSPTEANTVEPVRDDSLSASSQVVPQGALLTTLTSHSAAVNVVRWSPSGVFLASAGDDGVVLVHHRAHATQQSAFGERHSMENWMHRRPLRAHNSDVTDVAWSPDSERLASASVDNSIVVWNLRTEAAVVRLDGHKGLVKGLAWDPVGRFLASQSDDRTVRIWRTSDWKTEKVLSEPFESAIFQENSMSFFLRISWSPCGTHLVATNAHRKPSTHHAPMFSRQNGFDEPVEFIGHREPVISSRFSPCLYRAHPKMKTGTSGTPSDSGNDGLSKTASATYTVLSLGSKDGGCSVWQAKAARPFFEMYDAFDMEVIDMSWGTDGYTMVACSTDGKVLYLRYDPEELGIVVPPEEARTILTEVWRSLGGSATGAGMPLPESAVQLRMEETEKAARAPREEPLLAATTGKDAMVIAVDNGTGAASTRVASSLPPPVATANAVQPNGPTPPADPKLIAAQAEVRVRGGKRRITPISVTAIDSTPFDATEPAVASALAPAVPPGPSNFQAMPPEVSEANLPPVPAKRPRTSMDANEGRPVDGGLGAFARNAPAPGAGKANDAANGTRDVKLTGGTANGNMLRTEHQRLGIVPPGAQPVSHAAHLYAPSVVGLSMMLLPDRGSEGPGRCRVIRKGEAMIMLESREQHSGGGYVITCSEGGKVKWRDYHSKGGAVTALAGVYGKYATAATADGTLYFYSATSGRRLAPPIALDSAPYMLETYWFGEGGDGRDTMAVELTENEHWYVIVISRSAMCTIYDVAAKRMVCARSAASLLARPQEPEGGPKQDLTMRAKIYREISHCEVTSAGEPIVCLSDGYVFVYSCEFCSWLRVADDSLPNSEFRRTVGSTSKVGIVRALQSSSGLRQKGVSSLSGMGDLRRAAVESLAHLESLMEASVVLGSPGDYRYYLTNYAARIASAVNDDVESCTLRLRELCDELLNARRPHENKVVLGMASRDLLRDTVLPVISANRHLQRFVAEYSESLTEIEKLSSASTE